ncbi:MAG: hypothetical protein H7336_04040 [Bacteriovorax sp.]|nr:hypothetical protein [Bacteriovorax sp.]
MNRAKDFACYLSVFEAIEANWQQSCGEKGEKSNLEKIAFSWQSYQH